MKVTARNCILVCFVWFTLFPSCQKLSEQSRQTQTAQAISKLLANNLDSASVSLNPSFDDAQKALSLAQKSGNDTMIVQAWLVLGSNLRLQGKNEEAFALSQNALQLARQIEYQRGICQSLIESGSIEYKRGRYQESGKIFYNALAIAEREAYAELQATALNQIGKYLHTTGHFDESVSYYKRAIEIYKNKGNKMQSASVLLSLGKTYTIDGNLYMALRCYLDASVICEKTNNYVNLADVCNHLGTIYLSLEQPEKAMEYHRKALAYRLALNTPEGLANSFNNIGKVFFMKNEPDSAEIYFKKSLKNCEQIEYTKGKVKALTNLGKIYNQRTEYQTAKHYLLQSLDIARGSGYDAGIAEASLELGNTFLGLHQPDSARQSFDLSLKNAKSANLTQLYQNGYWGLYQCSLSKNDPAKSLEYYILYAEAEKKIMKTEDNQRLSELRISFETEKKEKDNEVLRKDNELKEMTILHKNAFIWMFIIALFFTIAFAVMFYFRFESKKKANRRLEQLNNQITKQNLEFARLNKELEKANREKDKIFSIIAHELRNPLYWFKNLTEMLSLKYSTMPPEKVQSTLFALDESAKNAFHLMDNLLHWSRTRLNRITPVISGHSLEKLIHESSRMYETILKQKNIQLITNISEDSFIKADADLFMCVVRNLLSNAIKFTPENGTIEINSVWERNQYIISVSDSGIGIDSKHKKSIFKSENNSLSVGLMDEKGSGFGLKLCKEFVKMNGGKIWVADNQDSGSCFCFTVPAEIITKEKRIA
jgi:signal transduction histidine kinase/Tfp pilus assembly protein PilF